MTMRSGSRGVIGVSDTCKRSPHLSRRPEIPTEAPTDAVKSQLEETVELNQGIARTATFLFRDRLRSQMGWSVFDEHNSIVP